jgi:membrane protease YdiL (CAAX protease family)
MDGISTPLVEAASYGFLYLAVLLLWAPKTDRVPLWTVAFGLAVIFGLSGKTLNIIAIFVIVALGLVIYCLQNEKFPVLVRFLSAVALFTLGAGLLGHRSMGFDNLLVLNKVQISKDALPFSLSLNFDVAVLGLFILGFLHKRIQTTQEWLQMFKGMLWRTALVIIVVIIVAYKLKYVHLDAKIPHSLLLFAVTNLFFVCMAEEAFFRGFIQKYLSASLKKIKCGNAVAIFIAAALFGAAHFAGGWHYVILSGIAGVGYGWIYFRTQRIEASILAHFALNMVHFLFFTYPVLGKSLLVRV